MKKLTKEEFRKYYENFLQDVLWFKDVLEEEAYERLDSDEEVEEFKEYCEVNHFLDHLKEYEFNLYWSLYEDFEIYEEDEEEKKCCEEYGKNYELEMFLSSFNDDSQICTPVSNHFEEMFNDYFENWG